MAVVSKQEIRVFREKFMKIVKYSANTENFTIDLPKAVHKKMGESVSGDSLREVNTKFEHALAMFDEVNTTEDKVIIIKRQVCITGESPIDKEYYSLDDAGYGDRDGVGIIFSCGVFDRFTTKVPGCDDKVDWQYIEVDFPKGFHGIANEWNFNDDAYLQIPWTQDAEDGLKVLAEALRLLTFKLLAMVKDEKSIISFLVSKQRLLPE